jgi:hypothetical protein
VLARTLTWVIYGIKLNMSFALHCEIHYQLSLTMTRRGRGGRAAQGAGPSWGAPPPQGGRRRRRGSERGKGERGYMRGREKTKNFMYNNGRGLTREGGVRRSWEEKRWLPTNRRSDRRIEGTRTKLSTRRTQRYPQIPPMMHGSKVIARRSCHRSCNRPELRRAIPSVTDLNWGDDFKIWKGLDERVLAIYVYIARVWRYFIFHNYTIFKIKK